jgi:hypothetical protein
VIDSGEATLPGLGRATGLPDDFIFRRMVVEWKVEGQATVLEAVPPTRVVDSRAGELFIKALH